MRSWGLIFFARGSSFCGLIEDRLKGFRLEFQPRFHDVDFPRRRPRPAPCIDRILSYISCYSAVINNEKEAENVFNQLVDDVKAALPPDRWGPVQATPTLSSVRRISYQDGKTGARIDIELLVRPVQNFYIISLYGWSRL